MLVSSVRGDVCDEYDGDEVILLVAQSNRD